MKNIVENNKLIAEFMGVFDKILSTGNIHSWSDAPFYYTTEDTKEKVIENISKYSKYNKDWSWLMRVVEKIENLQDENNCAIYNVQVEQCFVEIIINHTSETIVEVDSNSKIEAVYQACVEFINWYNNRSLDGTKEVRDTSDMRDKVLKAIMERYAGLVNLKGAMWEDEDAVLVNLCDDLNDEFSEYEVLDEIMDIFK